MKKWTALLLTLMLTLIASPLSAEENTHKEILSKIVEVANDEKIPVEIMIAIATKESALHHYDENGEVIIADDGGIGLMQITDRKDIDYTEEELMDLENNIRASAEILNAKWDYIYDDIIPVLKTWAYKEGKVDYTEESKREVLEHWYFPVMAYNGLVEKNIPKDSGETAYQDEVFQIIAKSGQLFPTSRATQIEDTMKSYFEKGKTYYTDGVKGLLRFSETREDPVNPVKLDMEGTYTRMNISGGETLVTFNRNSSAASFVNMYDSAQLDKKTRIGFYNRFKAKGQPLLFSDNQSNHFGYYTADDNGETVFLSSSNLISEEHPYANSDFSKFDSDNADENGIVTTQNGYVTVEFDEIIADDYVSERNFYLINENDTGIEASVTKEGKEVRVSPDTVEEGEVYTLHVHKARDEEGNMASAVKQKVKFE